MFFVTVLCGIPTSEGSQMVIFLVLLSLLFYPVINLLAKKHSEKKIMIISFIMLAFVFAGIALLGKLPVSPKFLIYLLIGITSFPLASLGILPIALLARLVSADKIKSGDSREGTFFAVNYFAVKLGQTLGISLFALLTIYGKDPGHDWGLRLSAICGCILCIMAGVVFRGFKEQI
jgi:GPH family glycoside/pentoside/hexuronide:cation symporter